MTDRITRHLVISGRVQGVSYRDWAVRTAAALGLTGWVRNRADGTVEAVATGSADRIEAFVRRCREGPVLARVDRVIVADTDDTGLNVQAVLPGATRTEIWERSGKDIDALPADMVMGVDDLVDAALAGFDAHETITIPPLADPAIWERVTEARLAFAAVMSRRDLAPRYAAAVAATR